MRERLIDEKDRYAIGWVKRVLEYETMVPHFSEELINAPEKTLKKYGFPVTPEDISFLNRDPKDPRHLDARFPDSKGALYAEFVNRKLGSVSSIRDDCTPKDQRFAKWRDIQIGRCVLGLGPQSGSIIHVPIAFELAKGCSVGCEFCGLNAGPLQGLFRYTDENAALWRDVLTRAKDLIGDAAGEATLYFGTEPLDNPDYELFKDDFRDIFGTLPQITTAVSTRNIERLRPLIKELNEDGRFIYRFSILSQEMFEKICEAFTPEELALVELLPQYPEAPGNHFAAVGRNTGDNAICDEVPSGGTISCISGFLVNMYARTVTLTTPVWCDDDHPEGQIILAKEEFTDAKDLFDRIERMIADMKVYLEPDDIVCTWPYLEYVRTDDGPQIESSRGTVVRLQGKDDENLVEKVFELIKEGCYTRREIVTKIVNSSEFPAVQSQYLFFLINRFWSKGIFTEKEG